MSLRMPILHSSRAMLDDLAARNIVIPEFTDKKSDNGKLNTIRGIAGEFARSHYPSLPTGLLSNVITTLFKVGACQELSQLFVLEWALNSDFKEPVNLILASDEEEFIHIFVVLGPVNCEEALFIGCNSGPNSELAPVEAHMSLDEFFVAQADDLVLVDPLVNFAEFVCWRNIQASSLNKGFDKHDAAFKDSPFKEYCDKHKLTKIIGVRHYDVFMNRFDRKAFAKKIVKSAKELTQFIHIHATVTMLYQITMIKIKGSHAKWNYNSHDNTFCYKADKATLNKLKELLVENGYSFGKDGEIDIVNTKLGKQPMLIIRNASTTDFDKVFLLHRQFKPEIMRTKTHLPSLMS